MSSKWLPAKWPSMPTTEFNFGFLTLCSYPMAQKSFNPHESTRVMTVFGKQLPTWATTQSKYGLCRTLVSSNALIQDSVSECMRHCRHWAVMSIRVRVARHDIHWWRKSLMPAFTGRLPRFAKSDDNLPANAQCWNIVRTFKWNLNQIE